MVRGGSQSPGLCSPLGQGLDGAVGPAMQCRKQGEVGTPQHPWVPLPAAPMPLCLSSSCCSWAGSTSPVYRTASVPSSVRSMNIRQTPHWGSWHGGGGFTTSQHVGAAAKLPPEEEEEEEEEGTFNSLA